MNKLPSASQHSPDPLSSRLKRIELQRKPSSTPNREIVQVLTEIPEGVESGWHVHPGEEVGYILAGTVEMRTRNMPTLTLPKGTPFLIPALTPHNALDLGPGLGKMLSTYFVEIGKPLASFVSEPAKK